MKNSVDVIIPTYNRQDQIQECIESIISQTIKPQKIIIVDSSEVKTLKSILSRKYHDDMIDYMTSDKGLTRQRNAGIKRSTADYVLFLDDDIVLQPDFINQSLLALKKNPQYSVVTGKIINKRQKYNVNTLMIIFQRVFFLTESTDGKFKKSGAYNVKHPSLTGNIDVDVALGGLTMYDRRIFSDFKFDTNYEYLGGSAALEDEDFSLQLKHKYKILYCTYSQAFHYHQSAPETRLSIWGRARQRAFNHRYFYRKHKKYHNFKSVFHFLSCVGMILDGALNKRSLSTVGGLLDGFIIFARKKSNVENTV
jgi:glycosyltransferase involved in cell wall biosynthesis